MNETKNQKLNQTCESVGSMPNEIARMNNHTERLVHLNEILEGILSKLIGQQSTTGENVKQLEPNGLLDAISAKNSQIEQQVMIAHDYATSISDLL